MSKQKVYLSASPDELEYEREVATNILNNVNFDSIFSYDYKSLSADGVNNPIDNSDIVVFILWKQFLQSTKQEYSEAVQKGKPVVILVKLLKENEFREIELTDFIEEIKTQRKIGTTPVNVSHQYRHYRSLADFEKELLSGVTDELDRKRSLSVHTTYTREGMYQLGTSIIFSAQDRLLIAQQTPAILLGPREYKAPTDEKISYEAEFHDALWGWVERVINDRARHCIILYNLPLTIDEIRKNDLKEIAKKRLITLKEYERKSGYRFKFFGTREPYAGPFAIGDNWLAMWLMGKHNAFSISFTNKPAADSLADVFRQLANSPQTLQESQRDLGI